MKTVIAALIATFAGLACVTAEAGPIVVAGSTYSIFLADEAPAPIFFGNTLMAQGVFDGNSQSFVQNGQNYALIESQSDLGGGHYLIHIELSSDRDMSHAVAGGAGGLYLGLGTGGNGLDFLSPVYLDKAVVSLETPQDSWSNDHLASDYRAYFSGAWSGQFLSANSVLVFPGAEGSDIRSLKLDFYVSDFVEGRLPEPGSLALAALALAGAAGAARRRQR